MSDEKPPEGRLIKCNRCGMLKVESEFRSIRDKPVKNCEKCRKSWRVTDLRRRYYTEKYQPHYERNTKGLAVYTKPSEYSESCIPRDVEKELPEISDYITLKKEEIKNMTRHYSKGVITKFFESVEPDICTVMDTLENDELKELIKIWLNTKFLESLR